MDASRERRAITPSARIAVIAMSSLWFAATTLLLDEGMLWWFAMVGSSLALCVNLSLHNGTDR
jgi:hypothetical protein